MCTEKHIIWFSKVGGPVASGRARCRIFNSLGLGLSLPFCMDGLPTFHSPFIGSTFCSAGFNVWHAFFSSGSSDNLMDSPRLSWSLQFSVRRWENVFSCKLWQKSCRELLSAKIVCSSLKHCGRRVECSGEACAGYFLLGASVQG